MLHARLSYRAVQLRVLYLFPSHLRELRGDIFCFWKVFRGDVTRTSHRVSHQQLLYDVLPPIYYRNYTQDLSFMHRMSSRATSTWRSLRASLVGPDGEDGYEW